MKWKNEFSELKGISAGVPQCSFSDSRSNCCVQKTFRTVRKVTTFDRWNRNQETGSTAERVVFPHLVPGDSSRPETDTGATYKSEELSTGPIEKKVCLAGWIQVEAEYPPKTALKNGAEALVDREVRLSDDTVRGRCAMVCSELANS